MELQGLYPELALRLMRCTRTEDRRVNKKGRKYRAALGEAGVLQTMAKKSPSFRWKKEKEKENTSPASPRQSDISAVMNAVAQLRETETRVEELATHDSVRLSHLENMMEEQGRALASAVNSLAQIRTELQMSTLVNPPDPGAGEHDGAPSSLSIYRAP